MVLETVIIVLRPMAPIYHIREDFSVIQCCPPKEYYSTNVSLFLTLRYPLRMGRAIWLSMPSRNA